MPSENAGDYRSQRISAYTRLLDTLTRSHIRELDQFIDHAWEALSPTGVSWIGFYHYVPDCEHLILGPCRDSPACSPIALHGVCGQGVTRGKTLIVNDVTELGEAYVACDPRDQSEIVIPIGNPSANLILDLDSQEKASFGALDDIWLKKCLLSCKIVPTESHIPSNGLKSADS